MIVADKIKIVLSIFLSAAWRNVPDLALLAFVLLAQAAGVYFLLQGATARRQEWIRPLILVSAGISGILLILGFLLTFDRVGQHFSVWKGSWIRGSAMIWAMLWTRHRTASFRCSSSVATARRNERWWCG